MAELLLCDKILDSVHYLAASVPSDGRLQVESLEDVISTIKAALEGAESRAATSSQFIGQLSWIHIVLHELDDQLEKIMLSHLQQPASSAGAKMVRLLEKFSPDLEDTASECASLRDHIRFDEVLLPRRRQDDDASCSFSFEQDVVIGRGEDKQALVDRLLDSNDKVDVIPVVGMAGLGKTTLAQTVYNDRRVTIQFEVRKWACVSGKFNLEDVMREIMSSTYRQVEQLGFAQLRSLFVDAFHDKLFLLVLDDVGERSLEKWWSGLREMLSEGARGSKILVTTQSERVSQIVGNTPPYELEGLSQEDSWSLFQKLAFGQEKQNPELIEIGKEIVRHCENLPLVIKVTGGLLYGGSKHSWLRIQEQIRQLWKPSKLSDYLTEIGTVNVSEFSADLKACVAYCSLLPTDYELNKYDLISLWMAQGFIQPKHEYQTFENAGEENFMELLRKGFFQGVKKGELGQIITFKKHNLCDLAASQMIFGSTVSTVFKADNSVFDSRIRHASFYYERGSMGKIPSSFYKFRKLRTFLWMKAAVDASGTSTAYVCNKLISTFSRLRVLDLHDFGIRQLPSSIHELSHLRYLDLSNNLLVELPESITELYYLQTLKLNFCEMLKKLPKSIGRLVHLRRLEIDECGSLIGIPLGLQRLTRIQTLTRFIVGNADANPKRNGGLRVLKGLNNLTGRLTLYLCHEWTAVVGEAEQAELTSKSKLSELRIDWGIKTPYDATPSDYEEFLEGTQLNPTLTSSCYASKGIEGRIFLSGPSMVLNKQTEEPA